MRGVRFPSYGLAILSVVLVASVGAASAKDYTYAAPVSPAVTEALQTPAKPQPPAQLTQRDEAIAIDTTPGQIRPATRIADTWRHDGEHRGFVCADKKCKTQTPVYNTLTPLEQEQGRIQP
ncbi:hypothetical protein AEAC466_00510 [Asticcacaulis sp. AC466]|uniref:hypothetical protein n=1 Tax=Asticcacaulis sp. AC466 TaxID=1282362 RepID=UPI0003C3BB43|nr:hypothetical protein [Asticcacaulis sp. AC466]ESQ85686.1 hypothetical protein AEAC466_00510 [Asticcacaulis sp. AC466]